MKKTSSKTKVLLTLLVTLLVIGAMAVVSFAADKTASYDNEYGQIVPTDSKLEARKTSYSFYGDKATLYFMRISEGKSNANYAVEIYSDKEYTQLIRSMSGEFAAKGNSPMAISWNFKTTPSGTYYGKCYTYISRDDGNVIDTDSVQTFKIKIDRLSKKTVKLNSVKNTSSGVKITWTPLTTATKYKVFRKAEGESKWKTLVTLGKSAYTYTDTTAKSGKTYKYTVRCYDGDYTSLYNKKGLSITCLSTPKLVDVGGSTASGYAKITWKAVPGAKGYEVYRKGGSLNNSEWKKIATVKGKNTVSYVDKSATKTDWYYTYSVKAYNGSNKSANDADGIDFNYIKAPVLKKAFSYTTGAKITWNDSSEVVTKYYIYRKTSSGWKKVGSTTKKYFTDQTAVSGKTYTYTVKGISKTNGGAYNSKGIKVNYLAMPQLGTVSFDSSNRAKVTWSTVEGAASYKIFRKINSAESWTEIATVKGNKTKSYLDKVTKKSGNTYQYTVKAINGKATSYYNTKGIQNMYLANPATKLANAVTADSAVGVKLTWKTIKGAEGYNIYRQTVGQSSWVTLAKGVTETSFYDATAENGVKYHYSVRAVNGSSMSRYNSVYIIALNRPAMESVTVTDNGAVLSWGAVEGADTYYVYRKAQGGDWGVIGSYSLNSFVDISEEAKTTPFYYTVVAEADGYKSDYDTTGMKNFVEATEFNAEFVPATETENPCIMVNWTFDSDAESIELFKSIGEDKVSLGVFDTEMGITQYKDEDIAIGTEYTYTAKAVKEGKVSTEKTAAAKYPHAPIVAVEFDVIPTYSEDGSYITINWIPVEFAESYEVYRRFSAEDEWTKIADVTAEGLTEEAANYVDVDIDAEISYYYTVKGVASDRDSLYDEEGKNAVVLTPVAPAAGIIAKQSTVTETAEDGTVTEKTVAIIVWDEVQYAQSYQVLRKTADSEWEVISTVFAGDDLRYQDDTIVQGVEYTYTILAQAAGRGEAINEVGADFCWALPEEEAPEEPTEPETPAEPEIPDSNVNIEENPLVAYQQAILDIRENGVAGYTKKTWNTMSKELESEELTEFMLPQVAQELEDSLITETEAEAVVYEKGSENAVNNMPVSNCSAEKVKSATAEKSGDNYIITIVMLDQTNCSRADTDGLAVMSNDLIFIEDQDCEVVYKEYTITATITADGQFVEIKHYCNTDITAGFTLDGASGTGYYGLEFETVYSDFIY